MYMCTLNLSDDILKNQNISLSEGQLSLVEQRMLVLSASLQKSLFGLLY